MLQCQVQGELLAAVDAGEGWRREVEGLAGKLGAEQAARAAAAADARRRVESAEVAAAELHTQLSEREEKVMSQRLAASCQLTRRLVLPSFPPSSLHAPWLKPETCICAQLSGSRSCHNFCVCVAGNCYEVCHLLSCIYKAAVGVHSRIIFCMNICLGIPQVPVCVGSAARCESTCPRMERGCSRRACTAKVSLTNR